MKNNDMNALHAIILLILKDMFQLTRYRYLTIIIYSQLIKSCIYKHRRCSFMFFLKQPICLAHYKFDIYVLLYN